MAPGGPPAIYLVPPPHPAALAFAPSFTAPEVPALQAFIGWNPPPAPVINPATSQPANSPLLTAYAAGRQAAADEPDSLVIFPDVSAPPLEMLATALYRLSVGNAASAGEAFRTARQQLDLEHLIDTRLGPHEPPDEARANADAQYAISALGEALWSPRADGATYRALDRVRAWGAAGGHHEVLAHERLARAALIRRTNGNTAAADRLLAENTRAMETPDGELDGAKLADPANRLIYLQSLMGKVDIQLQHAARNRGGQRHAAYMQAAKLLADIDHFIEEGRAFHINQDAEESIASQLYAAAIAQMMRHNYSLAARDAAERLFRSYPETTAADEMARPDSPIAYLLDENGRLRGLGTERHWGAAAGQALAHARHASRRDFWAFSAGGAAAATFLGAAFGYTDTPTLMQFSSAGATVASAARRLTNGLGAPETEQALATGFTTLSTRDVVGSGVANLARLGLTYAAFGGAVPGVGSLEGVPVIGNLVAEGDQLHGPGSVIAGLTGAFADQAHAAGILVNQLGLGEGLGRWWDVFTGQTTFGSGTQAWMNADARFLEWVADNPLAGAGHRFAGPWSPDIGDLKLAAELGAGGWAAATLIRPDLRDWAMARRPNLTRGLELALLPGAWLLSTDIGLALGVAPRDAWVIPGLAFGFQLRDQLMSGLRPGGWDFANVLRAPAVEMTYAAVGGQMMQGAIPAVSFGDIFGASMAIQVGLIPVGFVHALLLGYEQVRMWQNKFLRSFSAETLGNFFRIMFGWSTWPGTLASMICQTFVQCPWMTRVASEPVAGTAMRGAFRQMVARAEEPAPGTATEGAPPMINTGAKLEDQATVAGRRWRFLTPITGHTLTEALSPFLAFVFTTKGKDEPFETIPEERYFRMVWQFLTATRGQDAISQTDAANYLDMLGQIAADLTPGRRDARRGLLVATWAARDGAHGEAIRAFFAQNDWVFDHYAIPREMGTPPDGGRWQRMRQPAWFRAELKEPAMIFTGGR